MDGPDALVHEPVGIPAVDVKGPTGCGFYEMGGVSRDEAEGGQPPLKEEWERERDLVSDIEIDKCDDREESQKESKVGLASLQTPHSENPPWKSHYEATAQEVVVVDFL